jgi:hypothetical protein
MGIKETCRAIKHMVNNRPAFVELVTGAPTKNVLFLDEGTVVYPLGCLGNSMNIEFGTRFVNNLGVPVDKTFQETSIKQGETFNHVAAIVYVNLNANEIELAASGGLLKADRYRALLGMYVGGYQRTFARFKWNEPQKGEVEFLGPSYRGVPRTGDDPINQDFLRLCAVARENDEALHYFVSILEQAYSIPDESFKIARLFSLLEVMAGGIVSQFSQKVKSKFCVKAVYQICVRLFFGDGHSKIYRRQ